MIFNSVTFFIFLTTFLALYWTAKAGQRNLLLLIGSYIFYGWWDYRFLGLIAISTVVDFSIARGIAAQTDPKTRLRLLWCSVGVNLGILGIFKYFNFFTDSLVSTLDTIGVSIGGPTINILLPVGISFYTFQTISYSFDVYRKRISPAENILDFATYVAYFPQLVAGPIERASHLLPQIIDPRSRKFPNADVRMESARLILGGLFKKVVLADGAAPIANAAFDDPSQWSFLVLLLGIVAFSIQIYGDFAGYSDIARGVSLLLGINLVVNFTEPYLSRNITEFWRRWHISLSDWLRDYLYIPLGGNRKGPGKTYRNLFLTMLLGGLWHGASFNFVIWGALHGVFLAVHKLMGGNGSTEEPKWRELPNIVGTYALVNLAWLFFRAESFESASEMLIAIVTLQQGDLPLGYFATTLGLAALTVAIDLWQRSLGEGAPKSSPPKMSPELAGTLVAVSAVAILVFSGGAPQPFIYFQF